jgi:putative ABC transport system permease protein
MLSDLCSDIRFAVRSIRRRPALAAVIVLTLGLGIGASTAMFALNHAVLLRPLPYFEPDRLVLGRCTFGGRVNPYASAPDYYDYRDHTDSFESLAAFLGFTEKATVTGGQIPERAALLTVTDNLFPTLGVKPVAGRWFSAEEGSPGGLPVALVHERFARRWAGEPGEAIGRQLAVNGRSLTVVGVMPADFRFFTDVDVWVPARRGEGVAGAERRFHNWLVVGRLRPDTTLEAARRQVDVVSKRLEQEYPDSNRNKALQLDLLHSGLVDAERPHLMILMGAVGLVVLIACANVAGLLLARGTSRRLELAVRASLGATRFRLVRQLLTESLLLALVSGMAGLLLALWLQRLLPVALGLDRLGVAVGGLDWPVLGFALALSLTTGLLFGTGPALRASAGLSKSLAPGSRTTEGRSATRLRGALVASQVALSLFLLVVSGLLIQSFARLASTDPGFEAERLLTGEIQLGSMQGAPAGSGEQSLQIERRIAFFDGLREDILTVPGVQAVGFTSHLPIRNPGGNYGVWAADNPPAEASARPMAHRRTVLPGYFEALGIPLVDGRDIEPRDHANSRRVVVINELMARTLFEDRSAVGQRVMADFGGDEPVAFDVVGVVGDARVDAIGHRARPTMYMSYYQFAGGLMRFAVRTEVAPEVLTQTVRRLVAARDPDVPVEHLVSMEELIGQSVLPQRVTTTALTAFSAVALLLASIGLYGVLAFFVTQRTAEIGIRMSLGADTMAVVRLVLSRALAIVAAGLALGLAASLAGSRLLGQFLYDTEPTDAATFVAAGLCLGVVAMLASAVPAWRAAHVDPVRALRSE